MQPRASTIALLLTLFLSCPLPASAFWGRGGGDEAALNRHSGYDVNTVTTVSGHVIAIQTGDDHPGVHLKVESNDASLVICIGPQSYWDETGMPFHPGDEITVRGSMAQGSDGIIYVMAQKITATTQDVSITLRDETGRPAWAGRGRRRNQGQMNKQPTPTNTQLP